MFDNQRPGFLRVLQSYDPSCDYSRLSKFSQEFTEMMRAAYLKLYPNPMHLDVYAGAGRKGTRNHRQKKRKSMTESLQAGM